MIGLLADLDRAARPARPTRSRRPTAEDGVKVLHVSASFPRHVDDTTAPFLIDLVEGQRAHGWQPSVVAAHDAGLPSRHEVVGVPVRRVRYGPDRWEVLVYRGAGHGGLQSPLHALLLPGMLLALLWAVRGEVRRTRPDVVHAHWILPGGLVMALLRAAGAGFRTVLTLHGTDVELAGGRARPLARWIIRRADAVLAVSEPLARRAEELIGLPAGSVGVGRIPLPVALAPTPIPRVPVACSPPAGPRSRRASTCSSPRSARPEAADVRATLVVGGPERAALDAQVAELGLGDRVRAPATSCPGASCSSWSPSTTSWSCRPAPRGSAWWRSRRSPSAGPSSPAPSAGCPSSWPTASTARSSPPTTPTRWRGALVAVPLVTPAAPPRPPPIDRTAVIAAHAAAYGLPVADRPRGGARP